MILVFYQHLVFAIPALKMENLYTVFIQF
ncbi:hypothetical protein NC651_037635 [Populus alba x Populus x berolinensis]|nr:hypothetical protein NC651_037635 [Populus alba x Populus x berolinensis]